MLSPVSITYSSLSRRWLDERTRRRKVQGSVEGSIQWTMHRVDLVDALDDGPRFFRRDQTHLDMDSPDDQHTVLSLNLTSDLSCQSPVTGIDVARFQRTSKGTKHSTRSGRDDIIDRRSVRFRQRRRIHFVVLCDSTVHTENYGLRFARNKGYTKGALLAFNP
jgi:hypothetical protein